jgi:Family of unknown function (DUF6125)
MQNIRDLPREDLIKYLEFLSGLTVAVDGLWFVAAEKATDFDRALEMDVNVWTRYAPLLVKRIRKNFAIDGTGLAALKQIMTPCGGRSMWRSRRIPRNGWSSRYGTALRSPRWRRWNGNSSPASL